MPGPKLAGLAPAFQTDPSAPAGSVRVVRLPGGIVELQNFSERSLPVFLVFLRPETISDIVLLTKMALTPALSPKKEPPP